MANDHDEFLKVTMGCMDLVYNLARRLVYSTEDAQDLVPGNCRPIRRPRLPRD